MEDTEGLPKKTTFPGLYHIHVRQ